MPLGRPRKYGGDRTKTIGFAAPSLLDETLIEEAKQARTSKSELILAKILASDKETTNRIISEMAALRESVKDANANLDRLKTSGLSIVYAEVKEPEELAKAIGAHMPVIRSRLEEGKSQHEVVDANANAIYNDFEQETLKQGRTIMNPVKAKMIIKLGITRRLGR